MCHSLWRAEVQCGMLTLGNSCVDCPASCMAPFYCNGLTCGGSPPSPASPERLCCPQAPVYTAVCHHLACHWEWYEPKLSLLTSTRAAGAAMP
jgi:hypothetical protein